jgi:hypothetical protein
LLKQIDEELMAVVLQLWIEVSLDQLFKVRVEYPLLLLAALAVDN